MSDSIGFDSFTFTVVDPNGFDGLDTIRQTEKETEAAFRARIKAHSEWLKLEGFRPKPARFGGQSTFPPKPMGSPTTGGTVTTLPPSKPCPIHPTEMMTARDGKFGVFFSHGTRETGYCNGKVKNTVSY